MGVASGPIWRVLQEVPLCPHTLYLCRLFLLTLQNWWSATGHAEYYRTWNVPVYDFLYSYVYQELFQVIQRAERADSLGMAGGLG